MPRYIDADLIEPSEIIIPCGDGTYEYVEVAYMDDIREIPTADVVKREKGKWMKHNDKACWYCSECKEDNYYAYSWNSDTGKYEFQDHYCPNCGSEMEGSEE